VTIHNTDPFASPEDQRSAVRRFRGRLPSPVTIWTAGVGPARAGLTVSSILVADGEPGRVIGIVDEESSLWEAMKSTGCAAITMLHQGEHLLADRFAGILPSPGGLFAVGDWVDSAYGPVAADAATLAGVTLDESTRFGFGLMIAATIAELHVTTDPLKPLAHVRGRYRGLAD
jgi:3-hydroxy-9,10-secoandrosta-1,3,5(10)-triene-9,17-dione monooxygenase reductase component